MAEEKAQVAEEKAQVAEEKAQVAKAREKLEKQLAQLKAMGIDLPEVEEEDTKVPTPPSARGAHGFFEAHADTVEAQPVAQSRGRCVIS